MLKFVCCLVVGSDDSASSEDEFDFVLTQTPLDNSFSDISR